HKLTASWGIVGAVGETWRTPRGAVIDGYIRADLTLYPGYSGGPMLDASGRVAGMNTSQLWRGHGIAIASHTVQTAVQTLVTEGRIQRGYLGITSRPVRLPTAMREAAGLTQETGLLVMGVESDSPADKGGILVGDIVVALGGRSTTDPEDLQAVLDPGSVGKETDVTVVRGGQRKELRVTVGARQ
ncbi:MAG: PDZ domain-containing protein, partial [Chloroflexi bacterium]|nr:PDZ domain-containing protein [Chloroflexota bacterium]